MSAALEDEQHPIAQLKDLEWKRCRCHPRDAWRKAPGLRVVLLKVCLPFFIDRLGPGLERHIDFSFDRRSIRVANACQIGNDSRVPGAFGVSQVRTPIGQSGRRTNGPARGRWEIWNPSRDRGTLPVGQRRQRNREKRTGQRCSHRDLASAFEHSAFVTRVVQPAGDSGTSRGSTT